MQPGHRLCWSTANLPVRHRLGQSINSSNTIRNGSFVSNLNQEKRLALKADCISQD